MKNPADYKTEVPKSVTYENNTGFSSIEDKIRGVYGQVKPDTEFSVQHSYTLKKAQAKALEPETSKPRPAGDSGVASAGFGREYMQ